MPNVTTKDLRDALKLAKDLIEAVDDQLRKKDVQAPITFTTTVNIQPVPKPLERDNRC